MKRTILALSAAIAMTLALAASVFADEPSTRVIATEPPTARATEELFGNYHFLLEVSGITPAQPTIVGGFKSVSMGNGSDRITLKRGYTATDDLWLWRKSVEDGIVDRRSGSVIILDPDLETEIARFNFYEGWPCKWEIPDRAASKSELAIETLEIAVEKDFVIEEIVIVFEKLK